MLFLHRDERWENSRSYCLEEYGEGLTTFIFGLVIWTICPVMFGFQYILLGVILSNGPIRKWWEILVKTVKSMDRQVLIIHDYSVFEWSGSEIESDSIERESESVPNSEEIWWPILKLIFGYTIYMVPIG